MVPAGSGIVSRAMNPRLEETDAVFLAYVESNIGPRERLPGGRLTSGAVLRFEVDPVERFSAHYARYFAIGDDGRLAPDDFRHERARKIHAGLSCLRLPGTSGR